MAEECERAKFLENLGADTAKLCDLCNLTALSRVDASHQACIALEEIKFRPAAFEQRAKRNPVISSVAKVGEMRNTKTFTFEVCTTMGHYAVVSSTYAEAMQLVRDETREPVRSCRKCSE